MPPLYLFRALLVWGVAAALGPLVRQDLTLCSGDILWAAVVLWLFLTFWAPRTQPGPDPAVVSTGGCLGCLGAAFLGGQATLTGWFCLDPGSHAPVLMTLGCLTGAMLAWPKRPLLTLIGFWLFGMALAALTCPWHPEWIFGPRFGPEPHRAARFFLTLSVMTTLCTVAILLRPRSR